MVWERTYRFSKNGMSIYKQTYRILIVDNMADSILLHGFIAVWIYLSANAW